MIESLRRAVAAAPDDLPLRRLLAEQLLAAGDRGDALAEIAAVLQRDPSDSTAREMMAAILAEPEIEPATLPGPTTQPESQPESEPVAEQSSADDTGFDWSAAEAQVEHIAEKMFVSALDGDGGPTQLPGEQGLFKAETSTITLADVGGLSEVKDRIESAFLAPLRNPELRALYGKSLRGGLLLYGPPGCGKTFLARAVAGELGASFLTVTITDVLDQYIGNSEKNMHEAFEVARRNAPCVLFIDEVDALGIRRSQTQNYGLRGVVNQLLTDLDGVGGGSEGVFVLAATNMPWDLDPALRRPGRLDRTVLVLPPDAPAREAIFRYHLSQRPVAGIDLRELAAASDGLSGADIAYVCELASEQALLDSVRTRSARMIEMADVRTALTQVRPSIGPWLDSARNVVKYGDDDGTYRDLKEFLKKMKRL